MPKIVLPWACDPGYVDTRKHRPECPGSDRSNPRRTVTMEPILTRAYHLAYTSHQNFSAFAWKECSKHPIFAEQASNECVRLRATPPTEWSTPRWPNDADQMVKRSRHTDPAVPVPVFGVILHGCLPYADRASAGHPCRLLRTPAVPLMERSLVARTSPVRNINTLFHHDHFPCSR